MSDANAKSGSIGRRELLAGVAAAATVTIVKPSSVRGSSANSTVEIGVIGCGGRGSWIAPLFQQHGGYKLVACADYYPDHADRLGEAMKIPADRRYTTLSGYRKLLDSRLDAVVIESPPYFHPEQAADAVDAGKHVFVAKPIAVDVPGCQSIGASGKKATEKKLVFLVDFQTRANKFYQEAVERVRRGQIGKLVCVEARYPWGVGNFPAPETPEDRLRRWYCYKWLSGDFINEQNIHTLDVATWFIDADPVKAYGTGGSRNLRSYGDIWDYFSVSFTFPDNVVLTYSGNQCTPGAPIEIPCRVYGSKGTADTDYYGHVKIDGVEPWKGGAMNDLYKEGAVNNIDTFHKSITEARYGNETVAPSVRSNLTCMLGRTAGYQHGEVTWEELLRKAERLEPDLKGLKS